MKPIFVRPARSGEEAAFLEWSKNQPEFDAFVPAKPGTFTLAAYNKDKVVAYIPVQKPYMLETLAPNPEATELELATALKEFVQFLVSQSYVQNVSEIYFLGSNQDTSEFATNNIFEKLPYTVYRVKVSDLEPRKEI